MPTTALDLITAALQEIGANAPGENPSAAESSTGLKKLNRLVDQWNAQNLFLYSVSFVSYALTPNLQPHTIGPSGATFTVAVRPIKIRHANLVLNNVTPNVRVPLNIRDAAWWANQRVQGITSSIPTDLFYSTDWPLGKIYLWPVPTTAYLLELETYTILSSFAALTTTFSLPPGYEDAITYSLAESFYATFKTPPETQVVISELARKARAAIQSLNSVPTVMGARDLGIPVDGGTARTNFEWRTGSFS